MSQPGSDEEAKRKRDKVGEFLKKNITKGELAVKHAIGLGATPNVIPVTQPILDGPPRVVEVGWHPVGGLAGKWFAEETGLGKMITEKINKYPDPTQHWAVLVGDFAHQLWMDENFHVIYTNERYKRDEWRTFTVGETRFNDDAIRRAGEYVIQSIRSRHPAYNLISNNCQTYVLELLDAVKVDGQKDFGTTLAVYERLFSSGKVIDLFNGQQRPEQQQQHLLEAPPLQYPPLPPSPASPQGGVAPPQYQYNLPPPPPPPPPPRPCGDPLAHHPGTVSHAQKVMNDNTTQLDTQEEASKPRGFSMGTKEIKEAKRGFLSRFTRKGSSN
ncbi:hypothetical protein CGRA01v4_13369 [Colletotrichum graminicola]|uniref:PPPDE domain-containing protein n=1 Tax=Colletotrichum graminicola (strain M1.001 / M2 / FGSC 10212) TaxID=645133 RepID=E3QWV0_COLGM|nr:uncharacterized protein GLRG_10482 [Colletotrichum graminicola M1.001]EFQ35338.1 hypothetical protein GLRG_10482 [Colletotrichum graminicola M1.001]WDK22079.1 hypothetical protein CGRA01v4_13369 [Colletotrichum graminicola]